LLIDWLSGSQVSNKQSITEALVAQLPVELGITVVDASSTWWYNIRKNGGLRLSERGYQILSEHLKFDSYTINLEDVRVDLPLILEMDRKFQLPYYLEIKKQRVRNLVLFGSKEAVMINMYGDIIKFLKNYQP